MGIQDLLEKTFTMPGSDHSFLFISAPFSGVEVYMRNLREIISRKKNIDSTWLFVEWQPNEIIANIPPVSLNWTLKGGLVARSRVLSLEREGKEFDAIFCNHLIPAAFLGEHRRQTPIVMSVDTTPMLLRKQSPWYFVGSLGGTDFLRGLKDKFFKSVYAKTYRILAWSRLVRHSLIVHYDIPEDNVSLMPPGVNIQRWSRSANRSPECTGSNGRPSVLFVGNDFLRKGGDILLRVARRREFQDCCFHFVTNKFVGSIAENVHVHHDLVANSDQLLDLYRSADVFAMPTRADFSPTNAICEAMAMQLPVVSTAVGGLDEVVIDGENGFIVPVDDEDALAEKVRVLIASAELRARLGCSGRRKVESDFNIDKNAEIVTDYLKQASRR